MRFAAALFAAALLAALGSTTASAALKPGAAAPGFTARASLGGKEFDFSLSDALKKGPVVLYFYPAAFTPGCTQEAHEFAEAVDKFAALGASVIGVSADDIDVLSKFSVSECRSKFPVAADAEKDIMAAFDAVMPGKPEYANRTSYVIAPNGEIIYSYTALDPSGHVGNTLAAVEKWKAAQK
ncbi:MAG: peroxiredoxin [Hyphomicrobium sp.]|nr:peroxiredoxin [Hyphomicrobium sp.]